MRFLNTVNQVVLFVLEVIEVENLSCISFRARYRCLSLFFTVKHELFQLFGPTSLHDF